MSLLLLLLHEAIKTVGGEVHAERMGFSIGHWVGRQTLDPPLPAPPSFSALALAACRGREDGTIRLGDHPPDTESPADQPPVATNPVSPMEYPQALLDEGIGGRVLLRLFVDSAGRLVPDSTRVAESSGYPALDSAALAGAPATSTPTSSPVAWSVMP